MNKLLIALISALTVFAANSAAPTTAVKALGAAGTTAAPAATEIAAKKVKHQAKKKTEKIVAPEAKQG